MMVERRAVVLLSGGLDSATVLAVAIHAGFDAYALSFRYRQRHLVEIDAAGRVAATLGAIRHQIVDVDPRGFAGSALTDAALTVPRHDSPDAIPTGIPATYVPARNTIFLSYALAWAETLDAADVFIGANAEDHDGYPDCRPGYFAAFERMANLATKAAVRGRRLTIHAPLIRLNKAETIRQGLALGVDYGLTHTCYDPAGGKPCGGCDACLLRRRGFADIGIPDPAEGRWVPCTG